MSGSGLVYVAILVAWGVFFASRSVRSGGRDTQVAREGTVLRRRSGGEAPTGSYALLRPAAEQVAEPVVKRRQIAGSPELAAPRVPRISAATARRRRRTLGILLGSMPTSVVVVALGLLPLWAPAVPGLLLACYLVELRGTVRRARRTAAPHHVVLPHSRVRHPGLRHRRREELQIWDPWPSFESVPGKVAELRAGWEPRPVPLPTYVTASKVDPVPGRRIDIPSGCRWTSDPAALTQDLSDLRAPGSLAEVMAAPADTALAADPPPAAGAAEVTAEYAFEHKRAVND